ncbi:MAG: geranylgeranylglycerol-phosphate geranylgeranyltransferase [Candidatus Micrarchaeia archaeon]
MPYLELMRPLNSLMAGFGAWLGYSLAAGVPALDVPVALLASSAFLVCAGGQAINDYFDRDVDARHKPNRPIPSRRVPENTAYAFAMLLFAAGIFFAGLLSLDTAIYAVFFAALLYAYSAFFRKVKWLGNWVAAAGTGAVIVYGALPSGNYSIAGFLAVAAFLANAGREITKDLEDRRGDTGFKLSLPMVIGEANAKQIVNACYVGASLTAALPVIVGQNMLALDLAGLGALALAYSCHKLYQMGGYRDSQRASKVGMFLVLAAYAATLF